MAIESYISRDNERPTTRAELTRRTRLGDRRIRLEIAEARRRGVWIVACPTGGYYVATNPHDWNAFVARERRRALATFKRAVSELEVANCQQMEINAYGMG